MGNRCTCPAQISRAGWLARAPDGGDGLSLKALPTDDSPINGSFRPWLDTPQTWNAGSCGPNCLAAAMVREFAPITLTVGFVTADDVTLDLGAGAYDVACARSSSSYTAAVAMAFGKLGVLYTDPVKSELYLCDLPPF